MMYLHMLLFSALRVQGQRLTWINLSLWKVVAQNAQTVKKEEPEKVAKYQGELLADFLLNLHTGLEMFLEKEASGQFTLGCVLLMVLAWPSSMWPRTR